MDIISIILIIVALLNFILGIIVFIKNKTNKINFYFFLMMLFSVFWSLSLVGYFITFSESIRLLYVKLSYISALFIGFYYFLFCYCFPFRVFKISKMLLVSLYIFITSFALLISINNDYLLNFNQLFINNVEITRGVNYSLYVLIFSLLVLSGFIQLIYKYKISEGPNRELLGYVIFGTLLSFIFGAITNLLPAYWHNFGIAWLGPVFTLINFSAIAYLIFYKPQEIK